MLKFLEVGTPKGFVASNFDGGGYHFTWFEADGAFALAVVVFVVNCVGFVNAGKDGEDGRSGEFGAGNTGGIALCDSINSAKYRVVWVIWVVFNIPNPNPCTWSRHVVLLGI